MIVASAEPISQLAVYGPLGLTTAILLAGIAYALVRIANWVSKRMADQDEKISSMLDGDYAAARREVLESSADRRSEAASREEMMTQLQDIAKFSRETVLAYDSATKHQLAARQQEKEFIDGLREIQKACGTNSESMAKDVAAVRRQENREGQPNDDR